VKERKKASNLLPLPLCLNEKTKSITAYFLQAIRECVSVGVASRREEKLTEGIAYSALEE
jgi:hypothetical protein